MLSKYLNELYNNKNRDPDPTQNPNEKFWNPEPGPEPGLIIFWTLDPYPNPQYQFCKTQKPDPPQNFIGFSSLGRRILWAKGDATTITIVQESTIFYI
jgi:hypothetical protein